MDKSKILKLGLSALGMLLTIGSTMVNDKIRDDKMEEMVDEKVKKALNDRAEEL
jgi:hypothetical protein